MSDTTKDQRALARRIAKLRRWANGRIAHANKAEDRYGRAGAYMAIAERQTLQRVLDILDGMAAS